MALVMKNHLSAPLTGLSLALSVTLASNQPSQAQIPQFSCVLRGNYPVTVVRTASVGSVPIIVWTNKSHISDTWTPQARCQEVSDRFQKLHNQGQLKTLKTGKVNGQSVICGVGYKEDGCDKKNILLTMTKDRDPKQVLEQLLNTRVAAGGEAVYLSGDQEGYIKPTINRDGTASVDIDQVINSNSEPLW
ncbi:COP23 domain-containing protein [Dolichospermum circinale CS-1225]|uniref:COP23 domain-containing protein n=1 Tax=Dolichospermum circinale CS-537/01 TaxID=3021739 RepID=A0ABT5A5B4_9CYAN|nr:COP23 domain-containing protein [Dolichospermum circinale]MDB9487127.1 COP23 domain-containing protein [Dolichospermum circinale CS-537/01]MDB9520490.1 COP23 domain-containing protein [Dolichospermum circinale CS-1225]